MYCIIWRFYKKHGITPYVVSKFPDVRDYGQELPEGKKSEKTSLRRPSYGSETPGWNDKIGLLDLFNSYKDSGKYIDGATINIDYNTVEDVMVFKSRDVAQEYLASLNKLDWISGEATIVLQKEINSLKDLPAFQ